MVEILIIVIFPLILSNVIHMIVVKYNLFSFFKIPISETLFGKNKTWRGIVVLTILNALFLSLICVFYPIFSPVNAFNIGFILGFSYMLFELPNSWFKRKLGIKAGENSKRSGVFIKILDKTDSSFGVSLTSMFLLDISFRNTLVLFIIAVLSHAFFSWILVLLKVKKSF